MLVLVWIVSPAPGLVAVVLGLVTASASLVTVYCTAMIYASLKTVHQWHNRYVVPNYLALGLYTGGLLLAAVLCFLGHGSPVVDLIVLIAGLAVLAGKIAYWRFIATTQHPSTPESATGLGSLGTVRLFEAPHTEENYLMREMGFAIARKHAEKLRALSLLALFVVPLALVLTALFSGGAAAAIALTFAVLLIAAGVFVERWLFFAEARHVVTLYYGARAA